MTNIGIRDNVRLLIGIPKPTILSIDGINAKIKITPPNLNPCKSAGTISEIGHKKG